eukprot:CAMPEP_0113323324 /NCGR_PEP_ID=MMETSP0010_2-20120614/16221_1 /TAXON_ID=216773 ORGANISM="Corethron hystrix, Strain 308" /NCGR_SAMPLE_ID=MMETSP0010_2 /ASSEMBLY_ACC=CAM_ASM_000155 /LENGTH=39 /DNA_ID=CAMNT_0000182169 /DNA_START=460 /DNA_END=579 /DNA_ORIENTATION=- /assembly_acc=CAM_ASM_000155
MIFIHRKESSSDGRNESVGIKKIGKTASYHSIDSGGRHK